MNKHLFTRLVPDSEEATPGPAKPEISTDTAPAERGAELTPQDRYLAQLEALCDDAYRNGAFGVLVDVMGWYLARIAVSRTDPTFATADITRIFGVHVCNLVKGERAQAEAEKAKTEGVSVH
jgi:hypothetical protein